MSGPNTPTKLDQQQILQRVFDETDDRLRVDAAVSATISDVVCVIDQATDSIKVGDGTDLLAVNPDGSINVNVLSNVPIVPTGTFNIYGEVTAVLPGTETLVVSYTVPVGKTAKLLRVEIGGTNIAAYTVYNNSSKLAKKRTYFGAGLTTDVSFNVSSLDGLELATGDVIEVTVIHDRSTVGDFEGRIQYLELG